ncbi:hypothetical protein Tcan_17000 [Toxocara canis]|uniref:Uncharacterized protein n=1 Tax=Toxocara canis TaxID=6265 RepID=A0A0B2UW65_TOXCA|nr:hypothetical protein Tcan_17000 [Toxocara canis]
MKDTAVPRQLHNAAGRIMIAPEELSDIKTHSERSRLREYTLSVPPQASKLGVVQASSKKRLDGLRTPSVERQKPHAYRGSILDIDYGET